MGNHVHKLDIFFCRSLKCWEYYCSNCWDLKHPDDSNKQQKTSSMNKLDLYDDDDNEHSPPAMTHKPLMRNARTP